MTFTSQEDVVCHRYVKNVTKFVALLNKGQGKKSKKGFRDEMAFEMDPEE